MACPVSHRKIFRFPFSANQLPLRYVLLRERGVGHRHERWNRMRWTRQRRRALDARGRTALKRTAKSCGRDAPTLASSRAEFSARRTVTKSPVTGESTKETVKTIAQEMPDVFGGPVVTNARAFYTTRAAAGALSARHFLRPLFFGRKFLQDSDKCCRENVISCLVIARPGDQVFQSADNGIEKLGHNGYPPFAGYDGSVYRVRLQVSPPHNMPT